MFRRVPRQLGLAGGALLLLLTERVVTAGDLAGRWPLALLVSVALAGSLGLSRRLPVLAYLCGTAALLADVWLLPPSLVAPYTNLMGLFFLGHYSARRWAWWGPVIALAGVVAYFARFEVMASAPAGVLFVWLLAWAAGYGNARRREQLEAERIVLRRESISDERARIARELHDLVGHTLNVMVVQAGASRLILETDPSQARDLLLSAERTGREALDDLDRVLGVLRASPDSGLHPGLGELPRLAQRMTETGLAVTLDVAPGTDGLPHSLGLSVYRIVQEALTNALRHGRATTAAVSVRDSGEQLEVDVSDDGRGPQPGYQPGRGLLGITERASVFAGTVEHGGGERGGFRLRVLLPLP
ncbi:sensor histidine kinase [Longispora albida]|uniref:sensor histidine kinase n=1 Tax=Longispora albida TaxID=203523 RepID=UPI0003712AC7|nr:sensor histidine kinase [Longispora albida]